MKKIFFTVIISFIIINGYAQSLHIESFRQIVKDIPNHFKNLQKDYLKDSAGYKCYSSKVEQMPIAIRLKELSTPESSIFIRTNDAHYKIKFKFNNTGDIDDDVLIWEMLRSREQQYEQEIQLMANSGKYTSSNFSESNGDNITQVKNLKGFVVLRLIKNSKEHLLMFYSKS
ncbi:MAG: hypothetical protein WCR66_09325 [Bacteroidota bacterium]